MFCEVCKIEIPPAWVVVIASNRCPACGGEIMSPETKELLNELRSAMERMPNDPEGLAGWLLSNYKLHKIGTAEPTEFYRNKPQQPNSNEALKIAQNPKNIFLQRAGMTNELNKRKQKLAQIAQQVNDIGNTKEVIVDENQMVDNSIDEYESVALAQSHAVNETSIKQVLQNNTILVPDTNITPHTADITELKQDANIMVNNESDLHPALQADRIKRLQTQQQLSNGGHVGKIHRK